MLLCQLLEGFLKKDKEDLQQWLSDLHIYLLHIHLGNWAPTFLSKVSPQHMYLTASHPPLLIFPFFSWQAALLSVSSNWEPTSPFGG